MGLEKPCKTQKTKIPCENVVFLFYWPQKAKIPCENVCFLIWGTEMQAKRMFVMGWGRAAAVVAAAAAASAAAAAAGAGAAGGRAGACARAPPIHI